MSRGQKIVTIALWAVLISVLMGVIGMGVWDKLRGEEVKLPILFHAPSFSLVNQDNRPMTDADLRGHVWVAAFIFTTCADTCPMMSAKMADLQKTIHNPSVKLVSFTVNPEHDTPAVLKEYAARYKADPSRWSFLTGTPRQMLDVNAGMRVPFVPASGDDPILHYDKFLLVDAAGQVRGLYGTRESDREKVMERLATDADALSRIGGRGQ
jgi:protein SCO1